MKSSRTLVPQLTKLNMKNEFGFACRCVDGSAMILSSRKRPKGDYMERTLILIKPDAVQRGLIGTIITRFEQKGLKPVGIKFLKLSDEILAEHYSHLADKPFFGGIRRFMQSTPVVAMCLEGLDCVDTVRALCGITKSRQADPGTIRG